MRHFIILVVVIAFFNLKYSLAMEGEPVNEETGTTENHKWDWLFEMIENMKLDIFFSSTTPYRPPPGDYEKCTVEKTVTE